MKLHSFTAVASSRFLAEPAEVYPPPCEVQGDHLHYLHPYANTRGILQRRVIILFNSRLPMSNTLEIKNLHASIEGKEILKGIDLSVKQGEVHAIMGPNGSGKSTLANTLMGHPKYEVTDGEIILEGKNITQESPDERAKKGLFLAFQYPHVVEGVSLFSFLRQAHKEKTGENISVPKFRKHLKEIAQSLSLNEDFLERPLNEGFSGGEKKKSEILQMALLKPNFAILDETDSGLDIDALKIVAQGINSFFKSSLLPKSPPYQGGAIGGVGVLLITHYQRILQFISADFVHVMIDGKIVKSGGKELAEELEKDGYKNFTNNQTSRNNNQESHKLQ